MRLNLPNVRDANSAILNEEISLSTNAKVFLMKIWVYFLPFEVCSGRQESNKRSSCIVEKTTRDNVDYVIFLVYPMRKGETLMS